MESPPAFTILGVVHLSLERNKFGNHGLEGTFLARPMSRVQGCYEAIDPILFMGAPPELRGLILAEKPEFGLGC